MRRALPTQLLLVAVLATGARAQVGAPGRALGSAGAGIAAASGTEALFLNPALLGLPNRPRWSVESGGGSFGGIADGVTVGDLAKVLVNGDSANAGFLQKIPNGMQFELGAQMPLAAAQIRSFAFGLQYGAVVNQDLGRDVVDLVLNGYQQGRTDYLAGNTTGTRASYLDFAVAYGRGLGPLSLGVTGHYYHARSATRSRLANPVYGQNGNQIQLSYTEVQAPGGNGFGLDLGAAAQPAAGVTLSVAVTNALSSMSWGSGLRMRRISITDNELSTDFKSLVDKFANSWQPVDGTVADLSNGLTDKAAIPARLRVGAAWAAPSRTSLYGSYQSNVGSGWLLGGWDRSVALGAEQRLLFLSIRAGYATDLGSGRMLAGGLSLGPFNFDVAHVTGEAAGVKRDGFVGSMGTTIQVH